MIGYVCKYTPIHILESFGEKPIKIEPFVHNFDKSDSMMHPNMCFYSKSTLEYLLNSEINELILVNCCDSIRRLHDVLKNQNKFKFIHLIDLPHKNTCCSINLFKHELLKFIAHFEEYSGKRFDSNKFGEILKGHKEKSSDKYEHKDEVSIALLGARSTPFLVDFIENRGANIKFNFTCTGDTAFCNDISENEDVLSFYAQTLIRSFPCLRMTNLEKRYNSLNESKNQINGIIYHTLKFCDFYSYEYAKLKSKMDIPILKIETDYTEQSEGQMKTRIEAFIEALKSKQSTELECSSSVNAEKMCQLKIVMGIDSGSTSTNVVILSETAQILAYSIVKTGAKSSVGVNNAVNLALKKANLKFEDISYIISTGYGRVSIPFANERITEITCHAKGSFFLNPTIRTIIDIGGQDSKAIKIDDNGNIIDFAMNDKCAAGTGRFLEMMAKTLEVSIDEMGYLALSWKEDISITSMCSVFAESEIISLIAINKEKSDIIHGLCNSIASRTLSLADRIKRRGGYIMTGGVAKNIGVVKAIEEKLGEKIFIPAEPEIVGALGAALIALDMKK
ncbi:3-hydroxyacyl-ACP dehydratase [Clostridium bovifaecis]|uniref:3-hydroxyacyl-ACP dehydratase n=1 Tax=Clostridium bovifaecis TaxID=2184719 RepID=A0A6I6F0X5_9CLOT|nr:3-hydroxyacyl-ACP dehydratase [Clostridium bovifaecis]